MFGPFKKGEEPARVVKKADYTFTPKPGLNAQHVAQLMKAIHKPEISEEDYKALPAALKNHWTKKGT